jgi:protein-disulfide isomerase/uncharacterized membrane protein YphA (DoxX/SURF4 family)
VQWAGILARLVLGGVWVAAGWLKLGDPTESVRAVRAYDLLPEGLVPVVGHALPVLELVIGLCLLLGLLTRWSAVLSAVLLVAFVIGISAAWARGLSIECGCFGGGGGPAVGASDKYPWELARDAGLLLLSALLVWRPRTPWSLDERVLPTVAAPPEVGEPHVTGKRAERARAAARAAAIRREAEAESRRRRNRLTTVAGLLVIGLVVSIGAAVQADRDTTGVVAREPQGLVDRYALAYGAASPEVVVDVYEDFLCPFCGELETASKDLVEEYADRVQFRFHVIAFLDRYSTTAYSTRSLNALGVVLDTSGPEVAKRFHDELFARQPAEGGPGLDDDELVRLAVEAGATEDEVAGPIRDRAFRQWAANATDAASRAGVTGTPTVLVDGRTLPPGGADETVAALRAALEEELR